MNMLTFLSQYTSDSTRELYAGSLKYYFRLHYPTEQLSSQELSIRYLSEECDHKPDLIKFRDSLRHLAPKTRLVYLVVVIRWLEDNDIVLSPSFRRNIYGKETDAISEEYVPSNSDIARLRAREFNFDSNLRLVTVQHLPASAHVFLVRLSAPCGILRAEVFVDPYPLLPWPAPQE
jgi:hypothetical protein